MGVKVGDFLYFMDPFSPVALWVPNVVDVRLKL